MFKRIIAVSGLALLLYGCVSGIGVAEFKKALAEKPGAQLIDVRTPEEFAEGHLPGAKLIPVQVIQGRLSEIDPGKPVLLYCRSGNRSGTALSLLKGAGYKDVEHLAGGIKAWKAEGGEVIK